MANAPRKHARSPARQDDGEYVDAAPASKPVAAPSQAERLGAMKAVKERAAPLYAGLRGLRKSRDIAIALQRLDECVLWANRAIATAK
jgi:hypothetical protein